MERGPRQTQNCVTTRTVNRGRGVRNRGRRASRRRLTRRSVTRALRKFDTEPNALAVALRDHLGETGARTLVSHLRKLLK